MKISVITAVFNAENSIAKCVDSVASQQNADFEHILVDNCSKDRTVQLALEHNPNLKILSEPDRGIYDAMNKGARLASGDILAWLNADDSYFPETFPTVLRIFSEHPEAMIVHGNLSVNGREVRPPSPPASFGGARIFHPAAFIRRELFEQFGPFDPTYKICADLNFFLKSRKAGAEFHYVDRIFTEFALGGASTKHRILTAEEVRRALLENGFGWFRANFFYSCMRLRGFAAKCFGRIPRANSN